MAQLFTLPQQVRLNSAGTPYASAQAFFYRVSTLTAQSVYTTPSLSIAHPQPVEADTAGQWPPIWLDDDADYDYRVLIKTSGDVTLDDYTIARQNVLTQATIGEKLYPRTVSEIAASVTPSDYSFPPAHVSRYGFLEAATAAVNATAITNAIACLPKNNLIPGGTVSLPSGAFSCDSITVPQFVILKGSGRRATFITYAGSGTWCLVGGDADGRTDGSGVEDLTCILSHKDSVAIHLLCSCYATIRNLYLEGAIVASRTNIGVKIDGGSGDLGSAFCNLIEHVNCGHMQNAFQVMTSGTQRPTGQFFLNCSGTGDVAGVGSASRGLYIAPTCGDGVYWEGGNLEVFGAAFYLDAGALSINVVGTRLESNTKDVVVVTGAHASNFRGLINSSGYNVTDPDQLAYFEDCIALLTPSSHQRWRRGRIAGDFGPRGFVRVDVTFAASATATGTLPYEFPDTSYDVWPVQTSGGTIIAYGHNKGSNTSTTFSISGAASNSNTVACWVAF